jgi:hypothetical protein
MHSLFSSLGPTHSDANACMSRRFHERSHPTGATLSLTEAQSATGLTPVEWRNANLLKCVEGFDTDMGCNVSLMASILTANSDRKMHQPAVLYILGHFFCFKVYLTMHAGRIPMTNTEQWFYRPSSSCMCSHHSCHALGCSRIQALTVLEEPQGPNMTVGEQDLFCGPSVVHLDSNPYISRDTDVGRY